MILIKLRPRNTAHHGLAIFTIAAGVFVAAPDTAKGDGFGFMTPSKNINCNGWVSDGGGIDCTIVNKSGTPPSAKPQSCAGVWGHAFSLYGNGKAEMRCEKKVHSVDFYPVIPYGESGTFGDITCTSESTGLTCRNKRGHGFFLSRRAQKLF